MFIKRPALTLFLLCGLVLTAGCAVNRATATITPGGDLSTIKTYYIVQLPLHDSGVDKLIKNYLDKKGFNTTIGPEMPLPYKADAVVTYVDRWMWDITMYMLELTISLRNPTSNFPMAIGNSFHTSLTRKSPEEMVDEVLTNIFNESNKSAKETSK
jgi:hypothetical protein